MEVLDKFRDSSLGKSLLSRIIPLAKAASEQYGKRLIFMEVCGTHTVSISRMGIRTLLKDFLELRSGPGCPVCVTDTADIDRMLALAKIPGVRIATFGDMLRVPGSSSSLEKEKASGAKVDVVYSPGDALDIARSTDEEVVFLGVGFETTAPNVATSVIGARQEGIHNFSIYCCHKLIPPALRALLEDSEMKIDGFILPGHVSTVLGRADFQFIAQDYGIPAVITGFEPIDVLGGVYLLLSQILKRKAAVINAYRRVVKEEGNVRAKSVISSLFAPVDSSWRGFGTLPESGLKLRSEYREYDAQFRFDIRTSAPLNPTGCRCDDVLKGKIVPTQCPLFKGVCNPSNPVGPCMVSSEGACAAYYKYEV